MARRKLTGGTVAERQGINAALESVWQAKRQYRVELAKKRALRFSEYLGDYKLGKWLIESGHWTTIWRPGRQIRNRHRLRCRPRAMWLLRRARRIYTFQPYRNQAGMGIYLQSWPLLSVGGLASPPARRGVTSIALRGGREMSTIKTLIPNCSASFGSRGA
jgi:hypothetical protein